MVISQLSPLFLEGKEARPYRLVVHVFIWAESLLHIVLRKLDLIALLGRLLHFQAEAMDWYVLFFLYMIYIPHAVNFLGRCKQRTNVYNHHILIIQTVGQCPRWAASLRSSNRRTGVHPGAFWLYSSWVSSRSIRIRSGFSVRPLLFRWPNLPSLPERQRRSIVAGLC
jgi:hypothetical protein